MAPTQSQPQGMAGSGTTSFSPAAAGPRIRERLTLGLRARRGDQRAFEEIFYKHHQEIYRYCLAIVRNSSDAEDALQATMSAAMRALPGEEREVQLRPWLFRVAHNEAISIIRGRREQVSLDEERPAGASSSAAEEAEGRQRLRSLVTDLKTLPERQRAALVMRELSDLSYPEIAAVFGCAEGAARQTVYEARMALKGQAEGREMECEDARRAISDGDGRRLRGRLLKAHLASCESCADFQAAISARSGDLRALCAPLPVAAAGGILAGLVGGLGAAATGVGGAAAVGGGAAAVGSGAAGGAGALGGGAAGAVAIKAASVMAALAITAGAADLSGVVELPGPLNLDGSGTSEPAEPTPGAAGKPGSSKAQDARTQGVQSSSLKGGNGKGASGGKAQGKGKGEGAGQGNANGQGNGVGAGQGNGVGAGQGQPNHGAGNPGNGVANANPNSNAGGGGPPAIPPGQINKPPHGGGNGGGPAAPTPPGKPPASPGGGNSGGQSPATPPGGTSPGKGGPPEGKGPSS
ncbi:MAG: RNA polymerase sigma factor [Solirubrobacterales bacterium]